MSEIKAELAEKDETDIMLPEIESPETPEEPMTLQQMDAVIAVAGKIEQFAAAMDRITATIIKRSYENDWVCHDTETTKTEDRKANVGAAAAERFAQFLGIRESNWKDLGKEWSEDRKFFTYSYEADFTFGNRTVHAIGRAGNRDKFFGTKDKVLRPLEEVQEDDIRRAAFRACRKDGVRTLLGLRAIPVTRLIALGLNPERIKYVNFREKTKALDTEAKKVNTETGLAEKVITVGEFSPAEGVSKATGKPWRRLDIRDTDGTVWLMWSAPGGKGKREAILRDSLESKAQVKVQFQVKKDDRGEKYEIVKVNGEADA